MTPGECIPLMTARFATTTIIQNSFTPMKTILSSVTATLAAALSVISQAQAADVTAKISNVHLCCKSCVTGVEKTAAKVDGLTATVDKDARTVTLSGARVASAAGPGQDRIGPPTRPGRRDDRRHPRAFRPLLGASPRDEPTAATLLGIHDHDDRLPDLSREAEDTTAEQYRQLLDETRALSDLGPDDEVTLLAPRPPVVGRTRPDRAQADGDGRSMSSSA